MSYSVFIGLLLHVQFCEVSWPIFLSLLFQKLMLSWLLCSQLQMLGYDISWAAFNIIEVMSASKFTFKVSSLCNCNCTSQTVSLLCLMNALVHHLLLCFLQYRKEVDCIVFQYMDNTWLASTGFFYQIAVRYLFWKKQGIFLMWRPPRIPSSRRILFCNSFIIFLQRFCSWSVLQSFFSKQGGMLLCRK